VWWKSGYSGRGGGRSRGDVAATAAGGWSVSDGVRRGDGGGGGERGLLVRLIGRPRVDAKVTELSGEGVKLLLRGTEREIERE